MSKCKRFGLSIVAAFLPCLVWSVAAQEKGKPDKRDLQAKEVAEQFLKALLRPDLAVVMKMVDVPFFLSDDIKNDREVLRKELEAWGMIGRKAEDYKIKAVYASRSLPGNIFILPPKSIFDQRNKNRERLEAFYGKNWKRLKAFLGMTDRLVVFQDVLRDGIAVVVSERNGKRLFQKAGSNAVSPGFFNDDPGFWNRL